VSGRYADWRESKALAGAQQAQDDESDPESLSAVSTQQQ